MVATKPIPTSPAPAYSLVSRPRDMKEPDSDVISLANSLGSEETTLQDLQDLDVDTDSLLSTLEILIDIQNDAAHGTKRLQRATHGGDEILDPSAEVAKQLFELSKDLFKVIRSHVNAHGKLELKLKATLDKQVQLDDASAPTQGTDDARIQEAEDARHVSAAAMKWAHDCMLVMLALQNDVEILLKQDDKEEQKRNAAQRKLEDPGEELDEDDVKSESDAESWTETDREDAEEAEIVVTLHRHLGPLRSLTERVKDILHMIDRQVVCPPSRSPGPTPSSPIQTFPTTSSFVNHTERPSSPPFSPTWPEPTGNLPPYPPPKEPGTDYFLLRKSLYDLKDQLLSCRHLAQMIRGLARSNDNASRWRADPEPNGGLKGILKPASTYDETYPGEGSIVSRRCYAYTIGLLNTVEELLSNNGEDWLASESKGKMSFRTFKALDREWITSIKIRLESEQDRLNGRESILTHTHVSEPLTEIIMEGLILFGLEPDSFEIEALGTEPPVDSTSYLEWLNDRETQRQKMFGDQFVSGEEFMAREEQARWEREEINGETHLRDTLRAGNYLSPEEAEDLMRGGGLMMKSKTNAKENEGTRVKGKGKEKVTDEEFEAKLLREEEEFERQLLREEGETLPARAYEARGVNPERLLETDLLMERLAVLGDW